MRDLVRRGACVVTEEAHRAALARKVRPREESAMAYVATLFLGTDRDDVVLSPETSTHSRSD
jgi:hypothetical protein